MGRSRRPPPPPDYASLIPLQERANLNQFNRMLEAQRADAYTPFGSQTWTRTPDGRWTFEQRLSPEQQRLYDQELRIREAQGGVAERMLGRVRQEYESPANFASLLPEYRGIEGPQVQDRVGGPGQFRGLDGELQYSGGPFNRERVEDAIYNRQMRFLEPRLQQDESRLHQRLVSQGFDTRGDAYGEQMQRLREAQAAMRADAVDRAIVGAGQEASAELARILEARRRAQAERQADFENRLAASQFDLAAGQQRFGQETAAAQFRQDEEKRRLAAALEGIGVRERDRARLLNELNAFRIGNQIQLPNVGPTFQTPHLQGIDHLGLANQQYQNQIALYNAALANRSNFLGGLLGLGGAILGGPAGVPIITGIGRRTGWW